MSYASTSSYGLSRYQSGENDVTTLPTSKSEQSNRAVLFFHGSGGVALDAIDSVKSGTFPLIDAISKKFPLFSADWGGTGTWGNATVQTRGETGRTYMGTATPATVGKVHLLGISMGALSAFQYARTNPTKVQSIAVIIGAVDLDYIYQNNILTARSAIGTAWSTSSVHASCTATNLSATVLDASAASGNVGSIVAGTNIPTSPVPTIDSVVAGVSFHMTQTANGNGATSVTLYSALSNSALLINDLTAWDAISAKAWHVTDDVFTPTASIQNFMDSMTLGSRVSVGALGHTEAAVAAVPPADVISFFQAAG